MSNSTTMLDLISTAQAQKEVTANALFDAASPAMLYGRRAQTTAGLSWGYYGGYINVAGAPVSVVNGVITLTASATNYIEANATTGAVTVNTSAFTVGKIPLYSVVCGAASVTSYSDVRANIAAAVGAVTDGDKGDIVVSSGGAAWAIDSAVLSAFGRSLIDDASATAARATLGLDTAAVLAADTDTALAANSDSRIATQKAVKAYITSAIAGQGLGSAAILAADTDTALAANSDSRIATQKAVKAYIASAIAGQSVNILSNQKATGTVVSQKNEYQSVAASATKNLFTYTGSDGYVSSIMLACDSADATAYMKGTVNVYCNGEATPSISCAAENMFMAAYITGSNMAFSNDFVGANSNSTNVISLHFRLPIPFTNSIRIDFVNGSATASMRLFSTVVAQVGVANTWPRTRKLYVKPYFNTGVAPYANVSLVNASSLSPGLFVGLWMLFDDFPNNVTPRQAELEGNISINLDAAGTAQYISSGTEDHFMLGYYGAGIGACFCQNGEIGTTFVSSTNTKSFFRLQGTAPMAFQNALSISWQCGDAAQVAFTGSPRVWATAYYYTE